MRSIHWRMLISDDRANRLWHAITLVRRCVAVVDILSQYKTGQVDQTLLALIAIFLFSLTNTKAHFLCRKSRCSTRGHKTSLANILWSVQSLNLPETRISMHSVPGGDPHWGICILIYHDQRGAAQLEMVPCHKKLLLSLFTGPDLLTLSASDWILIFSDEASRNTGETWSYKAQR